MELLFPESKKPNFFVRRELPNPLLTYHLYDKFVVSIA